MMEIRSMAALAEKLHSIAGHGRLKEREWRLRCRLGWHDKSRTAVRHLLYGERRASLDEAKQIEAAHIKFCAEKVEANRDENRKLLDTLSRSLVAMEASDPAFFSEQVEAVREILFRRGNGLIENGSEG